MGNKTFFFWPFNYLLVCYYLFYFSSHSCSIFSVTDSNPHFSYRVTITSLRNKVSQLRNVMLNQSLMIDTHINCVLLLREISNNWAIDKVTLAWVVIGRVGKKGKKLPVEIIMLYLNELLITNKKAGRTI